MSSTTNIEIVRTKEHKDLIEALRAQRDADDRVQATWLEGSIALMVMTDDSIAETVAQRHAFAAMAITPALSMDMMKNAPPEGAYLLVRYTD
jgi:hypothetical protein